MNDGILITSRDLLLLYSMAVAWTLLLVLVTGAVCCWSAAQERKARRHDD